MEVLENVLSKIKVSTSELNSQLLQEVLIAAKRIAKSNDNREIWNEMAQTLWIHLQTGLNKFDDQLLCATCFYTLLALSSKKEFFLNEILLIVRQEIDSKERDNKENLKTSQVVSLMYGLFQSSFLMQSEIPNVKSVFEAIFTLLSMMANEYSRFTFIVFKTISSFRKVSDTKLRDILFSKQNKVSLLNLVNHNWENPISGVRDLNKSIFETLISTMDNDMLELTLEEINGFYWNKAKYLMLAAIIGKTNIPYDLRNNNWIDGLMSSLSKPGLVSAGTDMYFTILNNAKCDKEWCKIFLEPVSKILNGSSKKAIENFSNYWCLTTLKNFPTLMEVFVDVLQNIEDSEQKLYSSLSVLKQANSLGLISIDGIEWDKECESCSGIMDIVSSGLEHCNNEIRMMAFEILCVTQNKHVTIQTEYDLVLKFLYDNINSDCTVLRISILKSISRFLTQLHISYLNNITRCNQIPNECQIDNIKIFCKKIQQFLIQNLEIGGNYQRKIACVKLVHTFLNCLNEIPRKRQKQIRKFDETMIQMLKNEGHWLMYEENVKENLLKLLKDPAEDIRDNVVQLLLEHYSTQLKEASTINLLIKDGLKSLSSKFFYEISCGHSTFKLITNLLLQGYVDEGLFKTVLDVFNFARNEILTEYNAKRSIVESIQKGKQLHSSMSILYIVLDICRLNKYEIAVSNESVIELLGVLQKISNQFFWEQGTSTSSDFSKMSDMVESIIESSGHNTCGENDQTKISGLHQIVLNCLWLNVKASCDLSSLLIKYQKEDTQIYICEKALDIICQVLETCRHKGAIEAAGTALGQSIQHLTSLPDETEISKMPFLFLKNKLNELISEAGKMASVTRRGAGLSIMVHRIVSSDAKRGKPLFHYFMKTLLETCNNTEDIPRILDNVQNVDNEKDLPKAIYIHFLTRIVTDSSLASDMMFYSAELAELAFSNLTSPHWQIRNAALQLYGALIQKLIGQKKASGTDAETIATVACDELRTHSPKLWSYIQKQLTNVNYDDKLQYHSNLVPILNMLANIAKQYNFSSDMLQQSQPDNEMLKSLMVLLDSPIYTVRRLTAKCIYNIYPFDIVYENIIKQECISENYLHGSLMLIANYHKLYYANLIQVSRFDYLKTKYSGILNSKTHSYLCKELFEDLFSDVDVNPDLLDKTLAELDSNSYATGINFWANKRIQKYLHNADWDMMPQIMKTILSRNEFENYCEILLERIERDVNIPENTILDLINILLLSKNKYKSGIIWKMLYQISLKTHSPQNCEEFNIIVSYKLRYMIPFAARVSSHDSDMLNIAKIISSLTNPDTADVDMRLITALANNELSAKLSTMPEEAKVMTICSVVILLQDEDEDVRITSAYFYMKVMNLRMPQQPYVSLLNILNNTFLKLFLAERSITQLIQLIFDYTTQITSSKTIDEYNPFANDSNNIYFEANVLKSLIDNLKRD